MVEHTAGKNRREVAAIVADMSAVEGRMRANFKNQPLDLFVETNTERRTDPRVVFGRGRIFLLRFTVKAMRFHNPTILRMRALTTSPGTSTEGSR